MFLSSENAVTYRDREHEAVRALLRKENSSSRQTLVVSHELQAIESVLYFDSE